ncbi:unnamed protein product, partial [Rotaria socialis]
MATDKKEYEEKMDDMRKGKRIQCKAFTYERVYILLELRDSRNECDAVEKRLDTAHDEQQKSLSEFKEK